MLIRILKSSIVISYVHLVAGSLLRISQRDGPRRRAPDLQVQILKSELAFFCTIQNACGADFCEFLPVAVTEFLKSELATICNKRNDYGVASTSTLLKMIGLFCRL